MTGLPKADSGNYRPGLKSIDEFSSQINTGLKSGIEKYMATEIASHLAPI